jgi:hypothetical protein
MIERIRSLLAQFPEDEECQYFLFGHVSPEPAGFMIAQYSV